MEKNDNLNNDFSIASNRDEEQRRLAEEQERQRQIEQIRDQTERRQIEEMRQMRDKKLELERERAKREEEAIYNRAVQKKIAAREEMDLTMKGAPGLSLEAQKRLLRQAVRETHGAELDNHRRQLEQTLNREIDREINQSLERQRVQDQQREAARAKPDNDKAKWFERNAASATREPLRNFWDRSRDDGGRER